METTRSNVRVNTHSYSDKRQQLLRVARKKLFRDRWLYMMLLPGIIYFILFKYVPMGGVVIAFQDYNPFLGISGSPWVGFEHFERLFTNELFFTLLRNTLMLSFLQLLFVFPAPIIVALMLNELRSVAYKRFIQTMIYVPHFMSWVIVIGMFYVIFESQSGIFQKVIALLGFEKFTMMMDSGWFRPIYVLQTLWHGTGWGTIIYLAAMTGVDMQLYEAARIDGANRWRQLWHITLPSISGVIVIMLILKLSDILELGFDHVFLLLNPLNREIAEIFDTYVYTIGIKQGQFSYSTAVGLFKSAVGLFLVLGANRLARKLGREGIY